MKIFGLLVSLVLGGYASAQQFGAFPPSTPWKQINTDTIRLIYTPDAREQAERIAALIHRAAQLRPTALGDRMRKVNILLHNRTTLANGYVSLAPFRSEFYLVPGSNNFDFGNLPWNENLALHEYRHVQQYNNFRNGLSKGFYYLFGEGGQALANALTVPDWFFEGDAVHTETALSNQGRGRLSWFLSGYNALWLEKKNYSWLKLRNGSLKHYVPDHYQLGYLLANYGYLKYGEDFWRKVTHDASAFRGLFYPFQKAVKKYSGVDYKTFRGDAFSFYKQKLDTAVSMGAAFRDRAKTVTNYYFSQYIGQDSLLYFKRAYNRIPAFYLRTGQLEQRIALQSISTEDWFSYRNGKLAYTAYSTHPRWSLIDYSDIVMLDIASRKEKRLTEKMRYYTPDISPSGEKIAAISIRENLRTELHILDAQTGQLLKNFPGNATYLSHPRFLDEDRVLVCARISETNSTSTAGSRMMMQVINIRDGGAKELDLQVDHPLGYPYVKGDTLFFTTNLGKNDNLFALDLKSNRYFQLSDGLTGHYFPSAFGDTLLWSQFTANGMQLRKQALGQMMWKEIPGRMNRSGERGSPEIFPVAEERNILATPLRSHAESDYKKSTGVLNFHSWRPDYVDPEFTFSLYSDNILNTFSNSLFYRYNQNENSHGFGWNTTYGGFFPMLNAGVEYTYNRHINTPIGTLTLDQFEARLGYNIPLEFTKGKAYRLLNFGTNYVFNRSMPTGLWKDSLAAENLNYLHHFISWANYLPRAVQHIYPKLGYTFSGQNRHLLDRKGYQWLATGQLFLPSIANHSLVLNGSFQETDTNNTVFSNRFAFSRGYNDRYFSRMWRISGNYHFPIAYPDFGLASIVYLQRLRGNIFYDFSKVYSRNKLASRNLRSVGGELFFDTKWWNQLPVSFGLRASYLLDDGFVSGDRRGNMFYEFILPMDLIPD